MTHRQGSGTSVALMLVSLLAAGAATAQQIYRYVDESGQVVFSDQPPPVGVEAEEVGVPGTDKSATAAEAGERMERILSVADKLQQDRLVREAERQQAAQAAAAQPREPPPAEPVETEDGGWYPVYGPGYGWGPGWPGNRPPFHRPPMHRPPGGSPEWPPWDRPPEWSPAPPPPPPRVKFNFPTGERR